MNDQNSRNCPVCLASEKREVFKQQFAALSVGSLMEGYSLVVCANCGAGYADGIPDQATFNHYYAEMSKYDYTGSGGIQTQSDFDRFQEVVSLIKPYLNNNHRIMDIGCATGGLLAEFKKQGFENLIGVDPSSASTEITQKHYGIPAKALPISALNQLGETVDAAILTGVLEHVRELDQSIEKIKTCLKKGSLIYFEVPDATQYDKHFSAPFQFFSMEHINFFSPQSLSNLMARHGFKVLFTKRLIRYLSPQAIEPAIGGLFVMEAEHSSSFKLNPDNETELALNRYIIQSKELEKNIQQKISKLADSQKPLAVWGAGTHTLRLLETSRLAEARISCFIDSNKHYQGKTLRGIPILSPSELNDPSIEILISSQTSENIIFDIIRNKLKYINSVHMLYKN